MVRQYLWFVHQCPAVGAWCTSTCGWCMVHQYLWLVHGAPVPVVGAWCTSTCGWCMVHQCLVRAPVPCGWCMVHQCPVVGAWCTGTSVSMVGAWSTSASVPVVGAWCTSALWLMHGAPVPCGWCIVHWCNNALWLVHGLLVHQCVWLASVAVSCTDLTDYPGHEALTAALERSLLRCLHGLFRGVSCKLNLLSV